MALLEFLTGRQGRILRVILSLAAIAAGLLLIRGPIGGAIAFAALIPIDAAVFGGCHLRRLLGR